MKSNKIIFLLFLVITLVSYFTTIGAGFVYDFLGWQNVYDHGNFLDIINCFGYNGNHQILHLFFYSIYSVFHIQGLPWYLIFCTLHAFNGWLLYLWLTKITVRWNLKTPSLLSLLICILFLVHPYSVEAVVWKVCLHYLLSLLTILTLLIIVPKFLDTGSKKILLYSFLVYGLSLFLLEISYITPVVISLFILVDVFATKKPTPGKYRFYIAGGFWGLLLLSLLLNKWTLGTWVGHYGAATHLNINIMGMMSNEIKYLFKHLLDARYFSFDAKYYLFDTILSNPELVFFILTLFISGMLLYALKIKKIPGYIHLAFWSLAASMLYVLPVSNLFFFHLQIGTNDRFSYIPLVFLLVTILSLLSKTTRWIWMPVLVMSIFLQVWLQQKTINEWKNSTVILQHLRDTFRWHDHSHVFILNSPDNMNGIVMTSIIGDPSGIEELIDLQTTRPYDGEMFDVFQYNMTSVNDGVTVEQTGPMELTVTFKQWGNWWHRNGIGAGSYENEYYKAEVLDYPYRLTFKNLPANCAIIYQDGKEWKEFEFSEER